MLQVFQNLIGNAIKYKGEEKLVIEISSKESNQDWLISIKDNGIGMSLHDIQTKFRVIGRNRRQIDGDKEYHWPLNSRRHTLCHPEQPPPLWPPLPDNPNLFLPKN
jgi:hypothetical protein